MHRIIGSAPLLVLFWLVLSGHFTPLFLALGALSVTLVLVLSWRAGIGDREGASLPLALRVTRYFPWLGKEVLVSAVAVVAKVWSRRPNLHPVVTTTPSPAMSPMSQVVYANSITFTPGTLSLDLDEDQISVHGLGATDVETLNTGRMLRQVQRLEARR